MARDRSPADVATIVVVALTVAILAVAELARSLS